MAVSFLIKVLFSKYPKADKEIEEKIKAPNIINIERKGSFTSIKYEAINTPITTPGKLEWASVSETKQRFFKKTKTPTIEATTHISIEPIRGPLNTGEVK